MFLLGVSAGVEQVFPWCIAHDQLDMLTATVDLPSKRPSHEQAVHSVLAAYFSNVMVSCWVGQWPRWRPQKKGASRNCPGATSLLRVLAGIAEGWLHLARDVLHEPPAPVGYGAKLVIVELLPLADGEPKTTCGEQQGDRTQLKRKRCRTQEIFSCSAPQLELTGATVLGYPINLSSVGLRFIPRWSAARGFFVKSFSWSRKDTVGIAKSDPFRVSIKEAGLVMSQACIPRASNVERNTAVGRLTHRVRPLHQDLAGELGNVEPSP